MTLFAFFHLTVSSDASTPEKVTKENCPLPGFFQRPTGDVALFSLLSKRCMVMLEVLSYFEVSAFCLTHSLLVG